MKTFKVQRSFKEEVLITKAIYKDVDVNIEDITNKDILSMKFPQLRLYARAARMLLIERSSIVVDPQPIVRVIEPPTLPTSTIHSNIGKSVGSKIGKTSRYHYVYFDTYKNKFSASIWNDNKNIPLGYVDDEIDAALAADRYLDEIKDDKRPRNRDDFPEIDDSYLQENTK